MIDAGVLDDPKIDAAFGMHMAQEQPLGVIAVRSGPAMAAADRFTILIRGKGGHGARPQSTIDPIAVGAQIVVALQTLVSREVDPTQPAVVTLPPSAPARRSTCDPDTAELRAGPHIRPRGARPAPAADRNADPGRGHGDAGGRSRSVNNWRLPDHGQRPGDDRVGSSRGDGDRRRLSGWSSPR